jgi:hypothetical protein
MSSVPDANPYATPRAPLTGESSAPGEFYVVSPRKFLLLFVFTSGVYGVYWFWRHWKLLRDSRKLDIWPIPRGLFSIFFAHALNREIDETLQKTRALHIWAPSNVATTYVVFSLIGSISDRLAGVSIGSPVVDVIALACLLPVGYSLLQVQRAANAACGDPDGTTNHYLSAANWAWLAAGSLLLLLILIGILAPE